MPQRTIYHGTFAHTPTPTTLTILENTSVGVSATGTILFVEPALSAPAAASKHAWPPSTYTTLSPSSTGPSTTTTFFFPGLIDTHTHASQYPNVGLFGSSTLLSWLETYTFPLESSYGDDARARHVYARAVRRTLANGTTCAAYYATVHVAATNLLADVCHALGQRALVGRVCMDRMSPADYRDASPAEALRATQAVTKHIRALDPEGALVRPVVTPRFAPSCTGECLGVLGEYARDEGLWTQTHVAENAAEIALVKELFPEHRDYVDVYDAYGLLGQRTILAHAVHLTARELGVVAARGAKVAHCPASNTALTSGCARVREMLDAGVDVGLGTDMSGGYSPSILEMARQAMLVSRCVAMQADGDEAKEMAKLSMAEVLYLATRGGAACVGLGDRVGAFEVGMDWDAQLIDLGRDVPRADADADAGNEDPLAIDQTQSPVDIFGWESWEDRVAKWLYGGDDRNVKAVWVKGRLVHRLGKSTSLGES